MLKKLLTTVVTASMICSVSPAAFAENGVSVSVVVDASSATAKVSGAADGIVSITVMPEDAAFSDYTTELSKCMYFGFANAKNGVYEVSFVIPSDAEAGKYIIYAVSADGEAKCSFNKIANLTSSDFADINSASNASDLRSAAEAMATELGIDTADEAYDTIAGDAYKIVFALGKDYDSAVTFYEDFIQASALSALINADSAEDALDTNSVALGIDFDEDYANDSRLSDDAKEKLLNLITDNEWTDTLKGKDNISEVFADTFDEFKALGAVQASTTRVQIQKAICEDFDDIFDFVSDNSKYKKLKNPDKVFELMVKKDYESVDDVEDAFEDAVSDRYDAENDKGSGSGSGSGGGGKGSSVGISTSVAPADPAPVPLEPEIEEEEEPEVPEVKQTFTDVGESFWGYKAIEALSSKGLVSGYEDSSYRPDNNITRAEFAKLVVNIYQNLGGELGGESVAFGDVSANDWCYDAVSAASALGIIMGSEGNFNPNHNITRQDAATIIYRTLTKLGNTYSKSAGFEDYTQISDYAKDAVSLLAGAGVVAGFEDSTFKPQNTLTRAQAAQMIYNIVK